MQIEIEILIFLASLVFLAYFSDKTLDSSLKIAKILKVKKFIIGFLLLAIATSLPELLVSTMAALKGNGGIIIGNVIGSNIANLMLILGIAAVMGTLYTRKHELLENAEILLLITLVPIILIFKGALGYYSGLILIVIFIMYLVLMSKFEFKLDLQKNNKNGSILKRLFKKNLFLHLLFFLISLAIVIISSNFLVDSAINIASFLSIPSSIIGLTAIALGTSLPELMLTISALKKKENQLAFGNILGSCVANLTLVLGVGALISPLEMNLVVFGFSIFILVVAGILLNYSLFKYKGVPKKMGYLFLLIYILFILAEIGILPNIGFFTNIIMIPPIF